MGPPQTIAGTLIGRVFTSGEIQIVGMEPTVVLVPLTEGSCPIGVLELDFDVWDGLVRELLDPIVAIFVMAWIVKGRYTDTAARARRSEPLSAAAEVQWDLLPPLACSTEQLALGGILEPAYKIGGDSFDYAFDASRVDFTIVDAIGHGMSAVLMSAAAINSLRNSRRARIGIAAAYDDADRSIAMQFGDSYYVTGVIGTLDLRSGTLTWVNAGHVLPMLVRNGSYAGPLHCKPSSPLGLGGPVVEVAEQTTPAGRPSALLHRRHHRGSLFATDPSSATTDWPTYWSEHRSRTCPSKRPFGTLPTASSDFPTPACATTPRCCSWNTGHPRLELAHDRTPPSGRGV